MLPARTYYIMGSALLLVSALFFFQFFSSMTGNAILEDFNDVSSSLLSIWFLVAGLVLILSAKGK